MHSIDTMEKAATSVPRSNDEEWFVKDIIKDRLYVARDAKGAVVVFLLGPRDSFGPFLNRQSLTFSDAIRVVSGGQQIQGARLAFLGTEHASRAACHVGVELAETLLANPGQSNEVALGRVSWLIDLMESHWSIMSPERANGLAGECIVLRKLLALARKRGLPLQRVLNAWHGETFARRDFSAPGLAVEVKATAHGERKHRIGSMEQLLPQGDETVFLFSVGLRLDASGPRPLSAYISDARNLMLADDGQPDADLRARFERKLGEYGYDPALAPSYDRAYRFLAPHLAPQLFRAADVNPLSNRDFAGGAPPAHVVGIAYDLVITRAPLVSGDEEAALLRLLGGP